MQETAFSPAARQHTVTFPTWKCGRYTRRSATAWPLATVKIWDATTNQMRRCISPDQIEAYFIRSVPLLRVIARVDALIHPRIIYIPEYSRRTCSWFRGPWSQRRKLFTATATNAEYSESYVMKISNKKWRNREQTTGRAACTKGSKPREQLRLFKKSLSQRANWRKETKYFMRLGLFNKCYSCWVFCIIDPLTKKHSILGHASRPI